MYSAYTVCVKLWKYEHAQRTISNRFRFLIIFVLEVSHIERKDMVLFDKALWGKETGIGMSRCADSSGVWSEELGVAHRGQQMMCDWSDRETSLHAETAGKSIVTSATHHSHQPVHHLHSAAWIHCKHVQHLVLVLPIKYEQFTVCDWKWSLM